VVGVVAEVVVVGFVAAVAVAVAVAVGAAVVKGADYIAAKEFAAEAAPGEPRWVVDDCTGWQVEEAAPGLDEEHGRMRANHWEPCCLGHLQTGFESVVADFRWVACLNESQRKRASENATSLLMVFLAPEADFLIDSAAGTVSAGTGSVVDCPEYAVAGTAAAERNRFLIPSVE
jgi:hypothetical protein